jgi:ABC-type nitrate/sulfonate/bicarbonate transport system ATPase subunit
VTGRGCQLIVADVSKRFDPPNPQERGIEALDRVNLCVQAGELVCLLGPSGCGKTTLLNIIAGFEVPTAGRVLVNAREVHGPGPDRGVVFQEDALFPWLTARGNVAYGMARRRLRSPDVRAQVGRFLGLVGLDGFSDYFPDQLSGGMKQRVALARVMINSPAALLMDEPFIALDAQTRAAMQALLLNVWSELGQTILFITHDVDEALLLADRVYVMTSRPGTVLDEVHVALPRPRTLETITSERFLTTKRFVLKLLQRAVDGERPWLRKKPSPLAAASGSRPSRKGD